jgi:hypothetical protein
MDLRAGLMPCSLLKFNRRFEEYVASDTSADFKLTTRRYTDGIGVGVRVPERSKIISSPR